MKRRFIIVASVIALCIIWFGATGYRRGRADFEKMDWGGSPVYAKHFAGLSDGGSEWYLGRGYSVYKMHQMLMDQSNTKRGYLGGVKLVWWFPIRLLASDDEHYYYVPDTR